MIYLPENRQHQICSDVGNLAAQFRELGDLVCARIEEQGGKPFVFGTPVIIRAPPLPASPPPAPTAASTHRRPPIACVVNHTW